MTIAGTRRVYQLTHLERRQIARRQRLPPKASEVGERTIARACLMVVWRNLSLVKPNRSRANTPAEGGCATGFTDHPATSVSQPKLESAEGCAATAFPRRWADTASRNAEEHFSKSQDAGQYVRSGATGHGDFDRVRQ